MIAIDDIGWDWSYMADENENHALVADEEEVPTKMRLGPNLAQAQIIRYMMILIALNHVGKIQKTLTIRLSNVELKDNKIENLMNELEELKKEKDSIDFKIKKFENSAKDLDCLLGTQRSIKDKIGLGLNEYTIVPPPSAQVYSPPKNDLSWTGLPEFVNDTVTDYSRPTPSIDVPRDVSESVSFFEQRGSVGNVLSNPIISFVKETSFPSIPKVINTENSRKPTVKYAEMYRNTSQSPKVMSNNFSAPIIYEDGNSER
ncbi:hypothetical protein Tco_0631848 [Tanacetum coccineum]